MKIIIIGILLITLFWIGVGYIAFLMDKKSCEARWNKRGYVAEYTFWEGCMFKSYDGKWY